MLVTPKTGEIWSAFLCDPTGTNFKIRPVLIMDLIYEDDEFWGCGVLGITKSIENLPALEYILEADPANHLKVDSAVKYSWPEDVEIKYLKTKMGFVTREQLKGILVGLAAYEKTLRKQHPEA
jgi:hypothetical protein